MIFMRRASGRMTESKTAVGGSIEFGEGEKNETSERLHLKNSTKLTKPETFPFFLCSCRVSCYTFFTIVLEFFNFCLLSLCD